MLRDELRKRHPNGRLSALDNSKLRSVLLCVCQKHLPETDELRLEVEAEVCGKCAPIHAFSFPLFYPFLLWLPKVDGLQLEIETVFFGSSLCFLAFLLFAHSSGGGRG